MKRRDLLKIIGVGGVLPFIKQEETKAAPPEVQPQVEPTTYGMGSAFIGGYPVAAISGTAMWTPVGTGDPYASHFERANMPYASREAFQDEVRALFGGDDE